MPEKKKKQGIRPSGDIHLPSKFDIGRHPYDVEESPMEKMIKDVGRHGGTMLEEDLPYLEQYLHPGHKVLEDQPLRPTIGEALNIPHKKIPIEKQWMPDWSKWDPSKDVYSDDLPQIEREAPNLGGLGKFKVSTEHPDYDSVYDVWDFKTDAPLASGVGMFNKAGEEIPNPWLNFKDWAAKKFLQRAGKPFAVYERVKKGLGPSYGALNEAYDNAEIEKKYKGEK